MPVQIGVTPTAVFSSTELVQGKSFGLGDVVSDHLGNYYAFGSYTEAAAQYDCVVLTSTNYISKATSTNVVGAKVGVAAGTGTAGYYGWVQILGQTTVNCLSTCSAGVALYTSGSAGKLDDTTTSQTKISGITILANITASTGAVGMVATFPFGAV